MSEVPALQEVKQYQLLEAAPIDGLPLKIICLEPERSGTLVLAFIDLMRWIACQEDAFVITRIHGVLIGVDREDFTSDAFEMFLRKWQQKHPGQQAPRTI